MNLNYSKVKEVKPLFRFIKKDGLLRGNWIAGESSTNWFGHSTWGEKKRKKVKSNYIKRIPKGKIPVFYLDLVEHLIKELKSKIVKGGADSILIHNNIAEVNNFYRLVAYYEALIELGVTHRSN
jgi:hypothetical protein